METATVGIAVDHDFDKRFVYHIHFFLTVFIFEVLLFAAYDCGEFGKVGRNSPVESYVGERCLSAPAAGRVYAVNEGFDALFDFVISKIIYFDKRRKIGIERRERLRTCPFVLHNAEEVYHLIAQRGKVTCGRRSDLPDNAAKSLFDELL